MDCGTLTKPANGQVSHTGGTTFGQTATYSCNTGYELVGDNTRMCQATGVWSENAPICHGMFLLKLDCYTVSKTITQNAHITQFTNVYPLAILLLKHWVNTIHLLIQVDHVFQIITAILCADKLSLLTYSDINKCLGNNRGCHHSCHDSDGN